MTDLRLAQRFVSFSAIGALATATQYLILIALREFAQVNATVASTIGFVISAVLNYALNHTITFGRCVPHARAAPRFLVTASIGLLLNSTTMMLLTQIFAIHYLLAQLVATAVALMWNFIINQIWSFRPTS
jgi:putative flippase GtrA